MVPKHGTNGYPHWCSHLLFICITFGRNNPVCDKVYHCKWRVVKFNTIFRNLSSLDSFLSVNDINFTIVGHNNPKLSNVFRLFMFMWLSCEEERACEPVF